jgi:hypothetical protein
MKSRLVLTLVAPAAALLVVGLGSEWRPTAADDSCAPVPAPAVGATPSPRPVPTPTPVPSPTPTPTPCNEAERNACQERWDPETCTCGPRLPCDIGGAKEYQCREVTRGTWDPSTCTCSGGGCDPDGSRERACYARENHVWEPRSCTCEFRCDPLGTRRLECYLREDIWREDICDCEDCQLRPVYLYTQRERRSSCRFNPNNEDSQDFWLLERCVRETPWYQDYCQDGIPRRAPYARESVESCDRWWLSSCPSGPE